MFRAVQTVCLCFGAASGIGAMMSPGLFAFKTETGYVKRFALANDEVSKTDGILMASGHWDYWLR